VRVLLINANRMRTLMAVAPVGLGYVAEAARIAGHEVRLLDRMPPPGNHDALMELMRRFSPDVVGLSVRNVDNVVRQRLEAGLEGLDDLFRRIRRERPGAPIVIGGTAVSVLGKVVLDHLDADYAICGEGERSFPALLAALEQGRSPAGIPGVLLRTAAGAPGVPPAPGGGFGPSGLERWVDWRPYERMGATWPIQTKRGCSMPCSYCTYPAIEGRVQRCREPGEVVDEIERVMRTAGPRTFEIVDSTFNIPEEHALGFCQEILRRRLRVNLTTMGINPSRVSPELFPLMRRAGFNSMMVSPESGSESMLRGLRKGFGLDRVTETARLARKAGIPGMWFFLLGGPGETRETVDETLQFILRELPGKRSVAVVFTGIRVLPGTDLARDLLERGELPADVDLAEPVFYQSPLVDEAWVLERLNAAIARHPGIVHAAEGVSNPFDRVVGRLLHLAGVPPPYWRFLPYFLHLPPVRWGRRHRPAAGPSPGSTGAPPVPADGVAPEGDGRAGDQGSRSRRKPRPPSPA
jgi:radical SAM superfamily enzyme YgiQ (UPF0313 family)